MSASLRWSGLTEFLRELHELPAKLRDEGMAIVREEAVGAAGDYTSRLVRRTGRNVRGVKVEMPSSRRAIAVVVNTSPHSHLVDLGTGQRRTRRGANRGVMPKAQADATLGRIAQRRRAGMVRRLEQLLRDRGFQVGSAG